MKTIMPSTDLIKKILPKQVYRETVSYRPSMFCISSECEDGALLYNTFTGEVVLKPNGEPYPSRELVERRFAVSKDLDELRSVDQTRDMARLLKRGSGVTHFTILTTTDCNARCFYCYEMGTRRFSMSEVTANKIIDHIVSVSEGKSIKLSWFGGEPLYNMPVIDTICDGLHENGIVFESIMTSNGYYMTEDVAKRAKNLWNVDTVQITVDGTEKVYNDIKRFIDSCPDPFTRVMGNISFALDAGLNVGIRLNMDSKNADDLLRLVDALAERFSGRPNVHVHVEPLREFAAPIHHFGSPDELIERYWKLTDKISSYGLSESPGPVRELRINRCMADNDNSEVILPDGRIAKCEHVNESDTIGSIFDDERDVGNIKAWKEKVRFTECSSCSLYPLCISLKKCDWTKDGCPEHIRVIWLERIKRQMLQAYKEFKKRG